MSTVLEQITTLYQEAFQWYSPKKSVPPIHVTFYPYIGINHTIRIREGEVYVRIGEICREMRLHSHKGLAFILTGKLLRKKIPPGARDVYNAFIKTEAVRNAARENKRERGRKVVTSSAGEVYDLETIFKDLNESYFRGAMEQPVLTWSARKTYRILGHHDENHDHIAISRSLDSAKVPRYVVEFVVFHEMLHMAHGSQHLNGRRYVHTPAFKRDERKFRFYEEAERWIEKNVRHLKREAKRSK